MFFHLKQKRDGGNTKCKNGCGHGIRLRKIDCINKLERIFAEAAQNST